MITSHTILCYEKRMCFPVWHIKWKAIVVKNRYVKLHVAKLKYLHFTDKKFVTWEVHYTNNNKQIKKKRRNYEVELGIGVFSCGVVSTIWTSWESFTGAASTFPWLVLSRFFEVIFGSFQNWSHNLKNVGCIAGGKAHTSLDRALASAISLNSSSEYEMKLAPLWNCLSVKYPSKLSIWIFYQGSGDEIGAVYELLPDHKRRRPSQTAPIDTPMTSRIDLSLPRYILSIYNAPPMQSILWLLRRSFQRDILHQFHHLIPDKRFF